MFALCVHRFKEVVLKKTIVYFLSSTGFRFIKGKIVEGKEFYVSKLKIGGIKDEEKKYQTAANVLCNYVIGNYKCGNSKC